MDQGKEEILQKEKEIAQIEETIQAGEEETKKRSGKDENGIWKRKKR